LNQRTTLSFKKGQAGNSFLLYELHAHWLEATTRSCLERKEAKRFVAVIISSPSRSITTGKAGFLFTLFDAV